MPLRDVTLRQVVRVSAGGSAVRVRLDNTFGDRPLTFMHVHVALRAAGAAIEPGTDRAVTFGGSPCVTVVQGARALSDPVVLSVPARCDVAVSAFLPEFEGAATGHYDACQTSYLAAGDHTDEAGAAPFTRTMTDWLFLTGVDVHSASAVGAVVALGDSITNSTLSALDRNQRWPDFLARRLLRATGSARRGVLNQGIDGDLLLTYRADCCPTAEAGLARLERDVVAQTAASHVIVLLGVNDIAAGAGPAELIAGFKQLVVQLHARGIRVIGGTIAPFGGAEMDGQDRRTTRQAVNRFIRASRLFDGVVDFDAALRDPAEPERLLPAFDSGDHLHPHDPGYQAMGDAVDLSLLR